MEKLRRRYQTAGAEHKRKLLDEAVQMLGYHRKAAFRRVPVISWSKRSSAAHSGPAKPPHPTKPFNPI